MKPTYFTQIWVHSCPLSYLDTYQDTYRCPCMSVTSDRFVLTTTHYNSPQLTSAVAGHSSTRTPSTQTKLCCHFSASCPARLLKASERSSAHRATCSQLSAARSRPSLRDAALTMATASASVRGPGSFVSGQSSRGNVLLCEPSPSSSSSTESSVVTPCP